MADDRRELFSYFQSSPPHFFFVYLQFTMGATGKKVKGRYTFVYVYEDGEWKINHHHSSVLPEGIVTAEPITEKEMSSARATSHECHGLHFIAPCSIDYDAATYASTLATLLRAS